MSSAAPLSPSAKMLRRLLHAWPSLHSLGDSPLAELPAVVARCQRAGHPLTPLGRGLALQSLIQEAVAALRPAGSPPDPSQRAWRPYLILSEQFLSGVSPEVVRQTLYVSKATYFAEQTRALNLLAEALLGAAGPAPAAVLDLLPPPLAQPLLGRDALLADLRRALLAPAAGGATVALKGLPGVGKTALALTLAYDPAVRAHFDGGILWAGLGREPDPLAALSAWAQALGLPPERAAACGTLADRAALVHAAIGARRMLLLLDDAWALAPALALQVGGPHCATLITTRLGEVAAAVTPAAGSFTVTELTPAAGLDLLAALAPAAVAADRAQAADLVNAVGGLPLALLLMGGYLQRQTWSAQARRVQEALQRLQTAAARFALAHPAAPLQITPSLPSGAPISLQAAIGVSDAALPAPAQVALRALALFPPKPSSFSEAAALEVCAAPPRVLDALVDAGLLECLPPDRYTLHQTIADYAALAAPQPLAAARLVAHYAAVLARRPQDYALLERERPNLCAALELAPPAAFPALVDDFYPYLETRGLYPLAATYLDRALAQAPQPPGLHASLLARRGDFAVRRGQFAAACHDLDASLALLPDPPPPNLAAYALFHLGLAHSYGGRVTTANDLFTQGLVLARQTGDPESIANFLNALGFNYEELGDYPAAVAILQQALDVSQANGCWRGVGWAHQNLAAAYLPQGHFAQADAHLRACLDTYLALGDRRGEGWGRYTQGRLLRQRGQFTAARDRFAAAADLFASLGDQMGEAFARHNCALIDLDLRQDAAAEAGLLAARPRFAGIASPGGLSQVDYHLGVLARRRGDWQTAAALFAAALAARRAIGFRWGEVKAAANLGLCECHLGDVTAGLARLAAARAAAATLSAPALRAYTLTLLARVAPDPAALHQASALYLDLGMTHHRIEPQAALALLSQQSGAPAAPDLATLRSLTEALGADPPLPGVDDPETVLWTWWQVAGEAACLTAARQVIGGRLAQIPSAAAQGIYRARPAVAALLAA